MTAMAGSERGATEGLDLTQALSITVDIGPRVQVRDLSRRFTDLATLVDVGCRWAVQTEASRSGASQSGLPLALVSGDRTQSGTVLFWSVVDDREATAVGSSPPEVLRVVYSNPLELVLAGGALLPGVVLAARLVRDWSAKRRVNDAVAREAESEARITESRADLFAFMVAEAKVQGGLPVPARELVQITTDWELKVLNRIAEDQVNITTPKMNLDAAPAFDG